MVKSSLKRKLLHVTPTSVIVTTFTLLALALPAHADIPVKFFGALVADELSPKYAYVVDKFFENDPKGRDRNSFLCYEGQLLSLYNGRKVGVGVDCLNLGPVEDTTTGDTPNFGTVENTIDLSVAIDAVTFFFLPGGYIVSDGNTTVRPFFNGVGNGDGSPGEGSVTHLTGSIPGKTPTIVAATGIYRKLIDRGNVRLSGAVDVSQFAPPDSTLMFFSCIFVIQKGYGKDY